MKGCYIYIYIYIYYFEYHQIWLNILIDDCHLNNITKLENNNNNKFKKLKN